MGSRTVARFTVTGSPRYHHHRTLCRLLPGSCRFVRWFRFATRPLPHTLPYVRYLPRSYTHASVAPAVYTLPAGCVTGCSRYGWLYTLPVHLLYYTARLPFTVFLPAVYCGCTYTRVCGCTPGWLRCGLHVLRIPFLRVRFLPVVRSYRYVWVTTRLPDTPAVARLVRCRLRLVTAVPYLPHGLVTHTRFRFVILPRSVIAHTARLPHLPYATCGYALPTHAQFTVTHGFTVVPLRTGCAAVQFSPRAVHHAVTHTRGYIPTHTLRVTAVYLLHAFVHVHAYVTHRSACVFFTRTHVATFLRFCLLRLRSPYLCLTRYSSYTTVAVAGLPRLHIAVLTLPGYGSTTACCGYTRFTTLQFYRSGLLYARTLPRLRFLPRTRTPFVYARITRFYCRLLRIAHRGCSLPACRLPVRTYVGYGSRVARHLCGSAHDFGLCVYGWFTLPLPVVTTHAFGSYCYTAVTAALRTAFALVCIFNGCVRLRFCRLFSSVLPYSSVLISSVLQFFWFSYRLPVIPVNLFWILPFVRLRSHVYAHTFGYAFTPLRLLVGHCTRLRLRLQFYYAFAVAVTFYALVTHGFTFCTRCLPFTHVYARYRTHGCRSRTRTTCLVTAFTALPAVTATQCVLPRTAVPCVLLRFAFTTTRLPVTLLPTVTGWLPTRFG